MNVLIFLETEPFFTHLAQGLPDLSRLTDVFAFIVREPIRILLPWYPVDLPPNGVPDLELYPDSDFEGVPERPFRPPFALFPLGRGLCDLDTAGDGDTDDGPLERILDRPDFIGDGAAKCVGSLLRDVSFDASSFNVTNFFIVPIYMR